MIQRPSQVMDLGKFPAKAINDAAQSPHDGVNGLPNNGRPVVPHIWTMQGHLTSPSRVYQDADEALQHSVDNARFMRNDCGIMECLEARQRGTALLKWHLSPENEHSQSEQDLCDELTKIIERTPDFLEYRRNLLEALWYGRYACANTYKWANVGGNWRRIIGKWEPRHGDKLFFRYDDGSLEREPGQVGIFVSTAGVNSIHQQQAFGHDLPKIEATHRGYVHFLTAAERPMLTVHKHIIEDADYRDTRGAGAIHGIGIRSRIYWTWYQMQECLAHMLEYLERSALGIEIWHYPSGNAEAEAKTRKAAEERIGGGRSIVLVPIMPGENADLYGVQHIEPGMAGVGELKDIITNFYGHKHKRYILGQTLTSEAEATGMGSGVADAHLATYWDIVRYDAQKLSETITREYVEHLKNLNFPAARDINIRFVIDTEAADVEGKLTAWKMAFDMGMELKAEDVAGLIGATMPEDGDVKLSQQGQQPDLGGMPGGLPFSRDGEAEKYADWDESKHLRASTERAEQYAGEYKQKTLDEFDGIPGRWITIGADNDGGGRPVFIDELGFIVGGSVPKQMQGVHISKSPEELEKINEGKGGKESKPTDSGSEDSPSESVAKPVESEVEPGPQPVATEPAEKPPLTFKGVGETHSRLLSGEMPIDEFKEHYEHFRDGKDDVIANLQSDYNAKQLKVLASRFGSWDAKTNTKAKNAEEIYNGMMVNTFHQTGDAFSYQYDPFGGGDAGDARTNALNKAVDETTQDHLDSFAEDVKESRAKREEAKQAEEKALANPETLDDFRTVIRHKGIDELTPEQRRKHDELEAEAGREKRKANRPTEVDAIDAEGVDASITKQWHGKKEIDIWTVSPSDRVDRDKFLEMKAKAKQLGGWYYKAYKGNKGGFHFPDEEDAKKFNSLFNGESVDVGDKLEQQQQERVEKATNKLADNAEIIRERADEKLNQDRKTNTHRRASMAASAEADARNQLRKADTMAAISDAIASGEAKYLDGVRTGTHVDELEKSLRRGQWENLRSQDLSYRERQEREGAPPTDEDIDNVKYPYPSVSKSDLLKAAAILKGRRGVSGARQMFERKAKGEGDWATFETESEWSYFKDALNKLKRVPGADKWLVEGLSDRSASFKRMRAMNIHNEHELRAALREYQGVRGQSRQADPIKTAERSLIGKKISGFFPTPPTVVDNLLSMADIRPGQSVLEPSAGKGDIVDALKLAHPDADVKALELSRELEPVLSAKGHDVEYGDFMDHKGSYDRIVMNPPFEKGADIDHVRHAFDQLKPGGRLVAVMGAGAFGNSQKKAKEFRDWLDNQDSDYSQLPEGSFKGDDAFRKTGVNTYVVQIDKPKAGEGYSRRETAEQYHRQERRAVRKLGRVIDGINGRNKSIISDGVFPAAEQYDAVRTGGRWITIGGKPADNPERKHAGGFPVYIDGEGRILKGGPKGLRGRKVSEAKEYFDEQRQAKVAQDRSDNETNPNAPGNSRSWSKVVNHQAENFGMEAVDYERIARDIWKDEQDRLADREAAKAEARKAMGVTAADINRWENQGLDYASDHPKIKAFDTKGRELAGNYPALGWGEGYADNDVDYSEQLWNLLKEGKQSVPSVTSREYHDRVEEYIEDAFDRYEDDDSDSEPVVAGGAVDDSMPFSASNWDESKHPRRADGKFGSGGVSVKTKGRPKGDTPNQAETPEFKKWFGDSKIVDDSGKPLVVYKAMYPYDWSAPDGEEEPEIDAIKRKTPFPAFNGGEEGVDIGGFFGGKDVANRFAEGMGNAAIFPVYLRIENPAIFDAGGKAAGIIQFGETGREFREAIRSGNYDGVIIKNTSDEGDIYVTLDASQAKSAIGNSGEFSPEDDRLIHAAEGEPDQYAKRKRPMEGATKPGKHGPLVFTKGRWRRTTKPGGKKKLPKSKPTAPTNKRPSLNIPALLTAYAEKLSAGKVKHEDTFSLVAAIAGKALDTKAAKRLWGQIKSGSFRPKDAIGFARLIMREIRKNSANNVPDSEH